MLLFSEIIVYITLSSRRGLMIDAHQFRAIIIHQTTEWNLSQGTQYYLE